MKKRIAFALVPLLLTLFLSACASATPQASAPFAEEYLMAEPAGLAGGAAPEMPARGAVAQPAADSAAPTDRLVIMNADLNIVVADPQAKVQAIVALASRMGGFVVEMNVYQTYTNSGQPVPQGFVRIRVPAGPTPSRCAARPAAGRMSPSSTPTCNPSCATCRPPKPS